MSEARRPAVQAALGLGGNLGDPVAAMARALQALEARDDTVVTAVSRLYRTPPWGKTDQDWFFNACAAVETTLAPEALLDVGLAIERSMKRERLERWGPRTIDIDVLLWGDETIAGERLTVPHPRMTERAFVLMPLADILLTPSSAGVRSPPGWPRWMGPASRWPTAIRCGGAARSESACLEGRPQTKNPARTPGFGAGSVFSSYLIEPTAISSTWRVRLTR